MGGLAQILRNISGAWARLSPMQKAVGAMVTAAAIVVVTGVTYVSSQPSYSVLFSNLSSADANAIVEKLKESSTPYRLVGGGSTIEVPTAKVYDLRLEMAGQGLVQNSQVGFEVMDKMSFGVTEMQQRVNLQRAVSGELARTISQMSQVESARVIVALPERDLYSDAQPDATASVQVKTRPGQGMSPEQVSSIAALVSRSVPGLKPEGVAITDTDGKLLSDGSTGPGGAMGAQMTSTQFQAEAALEQDLKRSAETMLDRVLGAGNAVVRVQADLDFDSKETTSEIVEPGTPGSATGVETQVEKRDETYRGSPRRVNSVPPLSAAAGARTAGTAGVSRTDMQADDYKMTETSTKYEVSRKTERSVQRAAKVKRLSVTVLLNGTYDAAQRDMYKQAVSTAVGVDTARGDQISLAATKFNDAVATKTRKEFEALAKRDQMTEYVKWGVTALVAVMFLLFLRGFMGKARSYQQPELAISGYSMGGAALPGLGDLADMSSVDAAMPAGLTAGPAQASSVHEITRQDPEAVAKVIRHWLSDEGP